MPDAMEDPKKSRTQSLPQDLKVFIGMLVPVRKRQEKAASDVSEVKDQTVGCAWETAKWSYPVVNWTPGELQRLVWFRDIDLGVIVIEMKLWGRVASWRDSMACVETRGQNQVRVFWERESDWPSLSPIS